MFLIEATNGNLLFGFLPESASLLLAGISLIGAAIIARRILKTQTAKKDTREA